MARISDPTIKTKEQLDLVIRQFENTMTHVSCSMKKEKTLSVGKGEFVSTEEFQPNLWYDFACESLKKEKNKILRIEGSKL